MSGEPWEVFRLRASDVAWREIDGEVVLLDLKASIYISVNTTGTVLWKLLAQGATRGQLIEGLMSTFGASAPYKDLYRHFGITAPAVSRDLLSDS